MKVVLAWFVFAATCFLSLFARDVTVGWENIWPGRQDRHLPSSHWLWQADFTQPETYRLEKRNGAEGSIERVGGELKVRKTNWLVFTFFHFF